jgi:acyl carrier protein
MDQHLLDRLRDECYAPLLPGVHVAPDADFFVLGGDSLRLLSLVAHAGDLFGVALEPIDFFERPTLATLAESVTAALDEAGTRR